MCNRSFATSKGLKIHLSHHKNLTEKINLEKSKRIKGYIKENSIQSNSSGEAINDLEEFLNLDREEFKSNEDVQTSCNGDSKLDDEHISNDCNSRVSCTVCGFLAKKMTEV